MREHCHYCNKALYKMYVQEGLYSCVEDKEHYSDSKGNRMCAKCDAALLREGYEIKCPVCSIPMYTLNKDRLKGFQMTRSDLKGIHPQPDPYKGAYIKCKACNNEINLME